MSGTLYGRCSFLGGASFWELPLSGMSPMCLVSLYANSLFIESASLWEVLLYERYLFMEGPFLEVSPYRW